MQIKPNTSALALALALALLPACGNRTVPVAPMDGGPTDSARPPADHAAPGADRASRDTAAPVDHPPAVPDGPHAPCAAPLAAAHMTFSNRMVVCRLSSSPWLDQCQAESMCGPGWRLCKASEYRKRFGQAAGPPGTETSWIAGCVLSAGVPHAPTDQVCGSCSGAVTKAPTIARHCTKDMAAFVQRKYAGVVSYPQCMRIGVKSASNAAHWAANAPDYKLRQAFCCR